MLERIHVQGFKSLRDATVEVAPLVVLFSPNAAGKSNLLEALLLLSRLVGERTLSEAFAEGIRGYPLEAFTFAEGGLEQLLQGPKPHLRLEVEMSMAGPPASRRRPDILSYQVEVAIDPQSGKLSVEDERLEHLTANRKPRHRLRRLIPGYRKALDGPDAIELAGLPAVRSLCPRFDQWLSLLESTGQGDHPPA